MTEGWMRAVAEVFVEVRPAECPVGRPPGDRHLVAVSASEHEPCRQRPATAGPEIVIVSLLGRSTKAEMRTLVEGAAHAARVIAGRRDHSIGRVMALGLKAPARTRRPTAEIDFVSFGEDIGDALARSPQVLVADAAEFHRLPHASIERSTILGLDREDDCSVYSQLFVDDTRSCLPEAMVSTASVESLLPAKSNRRQNSRALGDAFVRIADGQR